MMKFAEYLRLTESADAVQPKNLSELKKIIEDTIKEKGPNCDLNFIDVSKMTSLSYLFEKSNFNGDISKWDTSNVEDMFEMFKASEFNSDISEWNVSNVNYMTSMFKGCPLEKKPAFQPKFNV